MVSKELTPANTLAIAVILLEDSYNRPHGTVMTNPKASKIFQSV